MSSDTKQNSLISSSSKPKSWNQKVGKIFPEIILTTKTKKSESTQNFVCASNDVIYDQCQEEPEENQEYLEDANSKSLHNDGVVATRLKSLLNRLRNRTDLTKEWIVKPPTPLSVKSTPEKSSGHPPLTQELSSATWDSESPTSEKSDQLTRNIRYYFSYLNFPRSIEPQSHLYICWLGLLACCYLYNMFTITLRTVFSEYQTTENLYMWFAMDYTCDILYFLDIILFKVRLRFLHEGVWLIKLCDIRKVYLRSREFLIDALSLMPLDAFYFVFGPYPILRVSRLLKAHCFREFFSRLDEVLASPFIARMTKATIYMLYTIHFYALVYYGVSKHEGIASNSWVYDGEGNAYVRCYFFAIKTATSIGKNPKPVNVSEQALMTFAWLIGVFIFAVLIGQVKDIVLTASRNQDEYRNVVDRTTYYLQRSGIPKQTISKVRLWLTFTWDTQKVLDETRPLQYLPYKMRMDLAMNVHIKTLSKVQLFQDCDENLLRDLVLKLRPVLFLPEDYVCKKGEVGKEMYIVQSGHVQVMGGVNNDVVLVTLSEGSVFGEISLLSIGGGNRRTADVRSKGFSQLFVLSKADLQTAITDYPKAQEVLKRKAEKLIKQNKEREKDERPSSPIIKPKTETPKLYKAINHLESRKQIADSPENLAQEDITSKGPLFAVRSGAHSIESTDEYITITIDDSTPNSNSTPTSLDRLPENITLPDDECNNNQDLACWFALTENGPPEFQKKPIGRTFSIAEQDLRIPGISLPPYNKRRNRKLKSPEMEGICEDTSHSSNSKRTLDELILIKDLHNNAIRYSNYGQNMLKEQLSSNSSRGSTNTTIHSANVVRVSSPYQSGTSQRRGLLNFGTPPDEPSSSSNSSAKEGKLPEIIKKGCSASLISISSRDSFDLSAQIYHLSSESEFEKFDSDVSPLDKSTKEQLSPRRSLTFSFNPARKSF